MSVDRGRRGSRATFRRIPPVVIGLLLPVAVALGLVAVPVLPTATAAESDPVTPGVTIVAAPADAGLVRQGTMLTVRVTVRNDTGEALPAGEVVLLLDIGVSTGEDLASWFAQEVPAPLDREVARTAVGALQPDAVTVLDLRVGAAEFGVDSPSGPHRALVEHRVEGTVRGADPTAVVWLPAADPLPTGPSAFVVPLTTPGVENALLTPEQLASLTARGGSLTRTLDATAGHGVTLALDPRIVASIRILGDEAPESARALLERLASSTQDSFALAWADADPALSVLSGVEPLTTPDRAPVRDPGAPLGALTEWDHATPAVAWPSTSATSGDSLDALVDSGAQTILAPSAQLQTGGPLLTLGASRVLAVDSPLSATLADAASARSPQAWRSAVAQASALLAAAALEGRAIVGAVDRDARSAARLSDLLDALDALPWRSSATVSSLLLGSPGSDAVVRDTSDPDTAADDDLVSAVSRALDAEDAGRAFARIAADPELLIAERRLGLLAATSPGWGSERTEALHDFVAASVEVRSSVRVVESSTITLLTDRTSLPITVENTLDMPVTVWVSVAPATGQLRVLNQRVEIALEPESRAQALVPVQSLTNGTVDITVSLRDATGRTVGDATDLELNLQAGWETAGTVAIAVLVAVLFAVGIVRDVRKRRRRRSALATRTATDAS